MYYRGVRLCNYPWFFVHVDLNVTRAENVPSDDSYDEDSIWHSLQRGYGPTRHISYNCPQCPLTGSSIRRLSQSRRIGDLAACPAWRLVLVLGLGSDHRRVLELKFPEHNDRIVIIVVICGTS
jgi:hypothetical protein